jgi:hypothetical protein
MKTKMHKKTIVVVLLVLATLLTACGNESDFESQVAVVVALTQTAAAQDAHPSAAQDAGPTETPVTQGPAEVAQDAIPPAEIGIISGVAHLQGPPTPPLTVYAVDNITGTWYYVETPQSESEAPFTLEVKPGTYQIFAFPDGIGYSLDGTTLAPVTVVAGQTISGIRVSPPSQSACGSMFGIPAAPDGRYAAIPGPSAECLANQGQGYEPLDSAACTEISNAISQKLNLYGQMQVPVEFTDFVNDKNGTGCKLIFSTTGQNVQDLGALDTPGQAALRELGWQENQAYGVGGAGGYGTGYQKGNGLCLMIVSVEPVNENLCPSDQPFSMCMNNLSPEKKLYAFELNCAQTR